MEKRLFIFLGVLCTFSNYSCTKNLAKDSNQIVSNQSASGGAKKTFGSTFFDPSGLVSASQHGILDTIQRL